MSTVFLARAEQATYDDPITESAPELPGGRALGASQVLLRRLLADSAMDACAYGSTRWNPLADIIRPGDKVLIKPNWVYHHNRTGAGMDCLITHHSVIAATLQWVLRAAPSQIVIGDAPIQGCDFQQVLRVSRASDWSRPNQSRIPVFIRDFRVTHRPGGRISSKSIRAGRGFDQYIEFDLGSASALEPLTNPLTEFRVTMYDSEALKKTHAPARHRYLIAREVLEADVVFNLPKLKTHRKAGITGALKNVVGVNGLKDYLPHHRKGSPRSGGDCYATPSALKGFAETCIDAANRSHRSRLWAAALGGASSVSSWLDGICGGDRNLEGGWYGNDTIWRTVLDLQRILRFGRLDGTLASTPARRVMHITDAIIAGDGEGPLFPNPVPLGVLTMSEDAAAAEWVHALMMGFDPHKISLIHNALHRSVGHSGASNIDIRWNGRVLSCDQLRAHDWPVFHPPMGWLGHCELNPVPAEEVHAC